MRKERKGKNCSLFSLSALVWLFDKAMSTKYREGPDGGWGWLVVLASFLTHLVVDGIIYSDGLFLIVFESLQCRKGDRQHERFSPVRCFSTNRQVVELIGLVIPLLKASSLIYLIYFLQ